MNQEVSKLPSITSQKEHVKRKRTFKDNLRQIKFNLTTIWANLKFIFRTIFRELKYILPLQDLIILFLMISISGIIILIFIVIGIPLILSFIPGDPFHWSDLQQTMFGVIDDPNVQRATIGLIGGGTVIIRLMLKSPIMKYKDKVNTKKDVTYVFGSSRFAEQLLNDLIFKYGYEDKVTLISDADLLWIHKLQALIDIYIVQNLKEFEKINLYEIIGFKNAKQIMILTENIELNQNILTNIRYVRPNVDIILLSQFSPAFVFSNLVQDDHLRIIDDLEATIQGLVISLSLDFNYPPTIEIDVPRTYIGSTGIQMSSDLVKQEVLLIHRDDELLSPEEVMQLGDRVILYYWADYPVKLTNRVVTELPIGLKKPTKSKKKKKDEIID